MRQRFTIDGDDPLERRLDQTCHAVVEGVLKIVPPWKLRAVVLGGGYGRGEGGVLRAADGDQPYNDLEFYVFFDGNRFLNDRQYRTALNHLGESLSPEAGLHVEFKVETTERLERGDVSMFSYDLVAGHRVVWGDPDVFRHCGHHLRADQIPLEEGTRLLFNRCTGLLLARERLDRRELAAQDIDFIARNIAKAALALGDAVLVVFKRYHWSCLERHRRLLSLNQNHPLRGMESSSLFSPSESPPWLDRLQGHHSRGVDFKLHPRRADYAPAALECEHRKISELSSQLWLWLESQRLRRSFVSPRDYAFEADGTQARVFHWRNFFLSLRSFGWRAAWDPLSWRYPRERLFKSLPLLLWGREELEQPEVVNHLRKQLLTKASDQAGLVSAYLQLWPSYG